ncbi:Phage terminase large subunit [Pseudovibrio sp. Ad5]|uniref:PBSX family phage terminase large subunit n=1 Tax=Pseudovibrio sp. Ad5 TaxID=989436 RepID=UPI0007B23488|nr:PBSX family phage terminase large subunit [Pseudovibrio sp. Ad5]KZL02197.1 Phage terminase large subunit [Pseudovibrio sp. Ad5]
MATYLTNPALFDFWEQVFEDGVDGGILYGGRSSSKTVDTARNLTRLVDYIPVKLRIMCVRRFQNKIEHSVYQELCDAIEALGLQARFDIQKAKIIHVSTKSEFFFYGTERNLGDIKGTSGVDILWVEEGEALTKEQWEIIEPTVRKEGSLKLILFNPRFVTDFVWKFFIINTPPGWIKRLINHDENPFLSKTMLRTIAAHRKRDPDGFENVYDGKPMGDSELSIFKRRWLDACVDAHVKLGVELVGRKVIGFDPADDGEDACATADMTGSVVIGLDEWKSGKDELTQSSKRVWVRAKAQGALVSYDTVGVGAFIGGHINDLNGENKASVAHFAFHAGGAVLDPDDPSDPYNENSPTNRAEYSRLKAQGWARTSRKAMLTYNAVERGHSIRPEDVLSFSSDIPEEALEELFTELCVPWWVQNEGKKHVVPKEKLKKDMGVKSHNRADALIAADNAGEDEHYDLGALV